MIQSVCVRPLAHHGLIFSIVMAMHSIPFILLLGVYSYILFDYLFLDIRFMCSNQFNTVSSTVSIMSTPIFISALIYVLNSIHISFQQSISLALILDLLLLFTSYNCVLYKPVLPTMILYFLMLLRLKFGYSIEH